MPKNDILMTKKKPTAAGGYGRGGPEYDGYVPGDGSVVIGGGGGFGSGGFLAWDGGNIRGVNDMGQVVFVVVVVFVLL